jgi:hypothetical protein
MPLKVAKAKGGKQRQFIYRAYARNKVTNTITGEGEVQSYPE